MRKTLTTLALLLVAAVAVAGSPPARAAMASTEEALTQKVLGDPKAPVTILAFESLTCPHCAAFHRETFDRLKKAYIDTGKVKLVFVDFPLDMRAAVASMLARCAGNARFFGMIEILFKNQRSWAGSRDFRAALMRMGRLAGLNEDEFHTCMRNEELYNGIREAQKKAKEAYGIDSTPTFVINGTKLVGAQPFEAFEQVIKAKLQ